MSRTRKGKEPATESVRACIEPGIHRKLKVEAAKSGLTVSQWVAEAIARALKKKAA